MYIPVFAKYNGILTCAKNDYHPRLIKVCGMFTIIKLQVIISYIITYIKLQNKLIQKQQCNVTRQKLNFRQVKAEFK